MLEGEGEVPPEEGGDGEVSDGGGGVGGGPGLAAVLEVFDQGLPLLRAEGLQRRLVG